MAPRRTWHLEADDEPIFQVIERRKSSRVALDSSLNVLVRQARQRSQVRSVNSKSYSPGNVPTIARRIIQYYHVEQGVIKLFLRAVELFPNFLRDLIHEF